MNKTYEDQRKSSVVMPSDGEEQAVPMTVWFLMAHVFALRPFFSKRRTTHLFLMEVQVQHLTSKTFAVSIKHLPWV